MAAFRLRCSVCGIAFYGRADARYCCGACRQKAYRQRAMRRAAETVSATDLTNAMTRARRTRQQARAARGKAAALRREVARTIAEVRDTST